MHINRPHKFTQNTGAVYETVILLKWRLYEGFVKKAIYYIFVNILNSEKIFLGGEKNSHLKGKKLLFEL